MIHPKQMNWYSAVGHLWGSVSVFTEAGAWHTRQITEGVNHTNTGHISTAKIGLRVAECEKKKVSMRLSGSTALHQLHREKQIC